MDMIGKIREASIRLFGESGFHGTSIRGIASEVGCTLPTLYYYYRNKEILFAETIASAYAEFLDAYYEGLQGEPSFRDFLIAAVKAKKRLSEYDRAVNRLFIRVWLGMEGNAALRDRLLALEEARIKSCTGRFADFFSTRSDSAELGSIAMRMATDMTLKIVFMGEDIPDETIEKEFRALLGEAGT
jgi:AcrR family transcriptional regulator